MPPGVPAVAVGGRGRRGVGGRCGRRPGAGAEVGPALGCAWPVPVSVGVDDGGVVVPSDGEDVGLEPGAAGDRSWPGRIGPAPDAARPGAGAGAPITLWAICCTGSGRCPVYAAAMPLLRATVTTTAVPPAPSRPIVRRGSERTVDVGAPASRNAATYCCSSASSAAVPGARRARTRSSSAQRARSSCSLISHHLSLLCGPVGRGTGTSGRGARRRAPPRVSCRPAPRPPPRRGRRPRGA